MPARAELALLIGASEHRVRRGIGAQELAQQARRHRRVRQHAGAREPRGLTLARRAHELANLCRAGRRSCLERLGCWTLHVHEEVEAIEQRAAELATVTADLALRALAARAARKSA